MKNIEIANLEEFIKYIVLEKHVLTSDGSADIWFDVDDTNDIFKHSDSL